MKRVMVFLSVLAWILPATPSLALDVTVLNPWIREAPPSVQTMAAYMVIRNNGTVGKTVTGANSPLFARVEFHETVHHGNMATMIARDSLVIDAGGQVSLKPNGYHMMLIAPKTPRPLRAGDKVPLALYFSDGSQVIIEAEVRKGQPGMPHNGGHGHHHHSAH